MSTPKGTVPWNAGKGKGWLNARSGYREVKVNGRNVREHRWVMERHLGRKLLPYELVHHKDGNKTNNSIDNLELVGWGEHTINHHIGSMRADQAKRTMQVFALLREENKRLAELTSDMLAALEGAMVIIETCGWPDGTGDGLRAEFDRRHAAIRAAIAKARGAHSSAVSAQEQK